MTSVVVDETPPSERPGLSGGEGESNEIMFES